MFFGCSRVPLADVHKTVTRVSGYRRFGQTANLVVPEFLECSVGMPVDLIQLNLGCGLRAVDKGFEFML